MFCLVTCLTLHMALLDIARQRSINIDSAINSITSKIHPAKDFKKTFTNSDYKSFSKLGSALKCIATERIVIAIVCGMIKRHAHSCVHLASVTESLKKFVMLTLLKTQTKETNKVSYSSINIDSCMDKLSPDDTAATRSIHSFLNYLEQRTFILKWQLQFVFSTFNAVMSLHLHNLNNKIKELGAWENQDKNPTDSFNQAKPSNGLIEFICTRVRMLCWLVPLMQFTIERHDTSVLQRVLKCIFACQIVVFKSIYPLLRQDSNFVEDSSLIEYMLQFRVGVEFTNEKHLDIEIFESLYKFIQDFTENKNTSIDHRSGFIQVRYTYYVLKFFMQLFLSLLVLLLQTTIFNPASLLCLKYDISRSMI